ncbi:hypothetical protein MHYP_G00232810 [Metynnis hypsauchen]
MSVQSRCPLNEEPVIVQLLTIKKDFPGPSRAWPCVNKRQVLEKVEGAGSAAITRFDSAIWKRGVDVFHYIFLALVQHHLLWMDCRSRMSIRKMYSANHTTLLRACLSSLVLFPNLADTPSLQDALNGAGVKVLEHHEELKVSHLKWQTH